MNKKAIALIDLPHHDDHQGMYDWLAQELQYEGETDAEWEYRKNLFNEVNARIDKQVTVKLKGTGITNLFPGLRSIRTLQ